MMKGPSPSPTPIRIDTPFRKQERHAPGGLPGKNSAETASSSIVFRQRITFADRGKNLGYRVRAMLRETGANDAVPLSP
jgi:hypothetical protein